jgi:hypothetical protein
MEKILIILALPLLALIFLLMLLLIRRAEIVIDRLRHDGPRPARRDKRKPVKLTVLR